MHPYAKHSESAAGKARAKHLTKSYKKGGHVHSDEPEDRKLFKKMFKEEEKGESKVEGKASGGRLDKFARGGKTKKPKGETNVNIVIAAPRKGDAPAAMAGGLPPPPGGGLPPPPMGGPPPGPGMPPMKRGGKVKMTAGADSGKGRLEKKNAYGLKPAKG